MFPSIFLSTTEALWKPLGIDIGALKQKLQWEVRYVSLIPGDKQLADSMTKQGASGAALLAIFQSGKMA